MDAPSSTCCAFGCWQDNALHPTTIAEDPLEIGGLPQSGGYGRDTDAALLDSLDRLRRAMLVEDQ